MNIFAALFGRKELPDLAVRGNSALNSYLGGKISTVQTCVSVTDLTVFVNDYSGYVREAAIARCVQLAQPELLAAIAGRLNDWVPEVRHAARAAMMTLMPLVPVAALLGTLPFVVRLLDAARTDHTEWVSQFETTLVRLVPVADLVKAVQTRDVQVSRACFGILKNHALMDTESLIKLCLGSSDDIVLATQALDLCAGLAPQDRCVQYRAAINSQFGSVRSAALRHLLALEVEENKDDIARVALLDFHASVRAVAIAYLQSRQFDLRAYFRGLLQQFGLSVKMTKAAIVSLASLRDAKDIPLIRTFVESPAMSVRLAALTSWHKLDPSEKDAIARAALIDPAARVRRFALQLVRKHSAYLPYAEIRSALHASGDAMLLLQFAQANKWDWLECIANVVRLAPANAELDREAPKLMRNWLHHAGGRYEMPSAEQSTFLASTTVIDRLRNLLHDNQLKQAFDMELRRGASSRAPNTTS